MAPKKSAPKPAAAPTSDSHAETNPAILEARKKLLGKVGDVRIGGAGSARRKKKTVHAGAVADDKRLQSSIKRLGCQPIPGIEEVNLFKNDGQVVHFKNPKVQAAIQSNCFVISGQNETKPMTELLPGIISQLGTDNLTSLKKMAETMGGKQSADDDDDDVPDLIENFEDVSNQK